MDVNPRHLASLAAIADTGSFSAAGSALGRSHSAISLHIKALEDALNTRLVDRSVRPARLTADGEALAEHARRLEHVLEDIRTVGRSERLAGRLTVGIVPTAMVRLAPPALARLRAEHPDLALDIRTGLSSELAQAVRAGELDAAVLTEPHTVPDDLALHRVAEEPLVVIGPADATATRDVELLTAHRFIWFSRKTWAGQQIEHALAGRGIRVRAAMEVDSLEAIRSLVRHGLGVSIVPQTDPSPDGLTRLAFGNPQLKRRVALISRPATPKSRLLAVLQAALTEAGSVPL